MQNKLPPGFPVKIGKCNLDVSYVTGFAHQSIGIYSRTNPDFMRIRASHYMSAKPKNVPNFRNTGVSNCYRQNNFSTV